METEMPNFFFPVVRKRVFCGYTRRRSRGSGEPLDRGSSAGAGVSPTPFAPPLLPALLGQQSFSKHLLPVD